MNTTMRKQTTKTAIVLLVAASMVTIGSFSALAKRHNGPGGFGNNGPMMGMMDRGPQGQPVLGLWKNPVMVEELGITDEQITQLKEADFAAREKQIALEAELEAARLDMEKAFTADSIDKDAALKLAQETADIRGKLFVQRTESRLTVLDILTQEQHDKLKELRAEYRGKRPNKSKGLGMNRANGPGPRYLNAVDTSESAGN